MTVTVFLVPHVALMSLPMIGPMAFIPVQAAAAWLVNLIEGEAGAQPLRPDQQAHKAAEMTPLHNTYSRMPAPSPNGPIIGYNNSPEPSQHAGSGQDMTGPSMGDTYQNEQMSGYSGHANGPGHKWASPHLHGSDYGHQYAYG